MNHKHIATGVLVLSLAACRDKAAAGMELKAMPMLPAFRAHLDSVAQYPAMMRAAMPDHRSEVKELVDAMHSDMTMMGMHSDAAYEALADSVSKVRRRWEPPAPPISTARSPAMWISCVGWRPPTRPRLPGSGSGNSHWPPSRITLAPRPVSRF